MFYDFTKNVYHVNDNNAAEFSNQSMHYISLKHEPYIKMYENDFFFSWQKTGQGKNFSFFGKYIYFLFKSCQNVSGTFIFATYNPAQNCWDISIQFSISRAVTIMSKRNKFDLLPTPDAMLFRLSSSHRAFLVISQTTLQ